MKTNLIQIQTIKQSLALKRKSIEVNGKLVKTPFYAPMPNNTTDMSILCEMMDRDKIETIGKEGEEVDFVGAVVYRVMEHDKVIAEQEALRAQQLITTEQSLPKSYVTLSSMKIKLIDPCTEFYRKRMRPIIATYQNLPLPAYLQDYLENLNRVHESLLTQTHINFWRSLFKKEGETAKIAHFIKWHEATQSQRKADVFIPPVPYIDHHSKNELLRLAMEINSDALNLVGEKAAVYFNFNADMFRDKQFVSEVCEFIERANAKFNVFKILDADKIIGKGFGQDAKQNFQIFLRTIKSLKDEDSEKIFGLLCGGGLGYCLLGAGFDFFVDTVNNYAQDFMARRSGGMNYRKLFNPETLSLEPIEGAKNMLIENGTLPGDNIVIKKYEGKKVTDFTRKEWSMDCRRHGVLEWNKLLKVVARAIDEGEDTLFFDKVQNSDYAVLGSILRKVNS
jgi:hypothetical protein